MYEMSSFMIYASAQLDHPQNQSIVHSRISRAPTVRMSEMLLNNKPLRQAMWAIHNAKFVNISWNKIAPYAMTIYRKIFQLLGILQHIQMQSSLYTSGTTTTIRVVNKNVMYQKLNPVQRKNNVALNEFVIGLLNSTLDKIHSHSPQMALAYKALCVATLPRLSQQRMYQRVYSKKVPPATKYYDDSKKYIQRDEDDTEHEGDDADIESVLVGLDDDDDDDDRKSSVLVGLD
jgi:hypothetical protein